MQPHTIVMDPVRLQLSGSGIAGFYWPVSPGRIEAFAGRVMSNLAALARRGGESFSKELGVAATFFASECTGLLQALLLKQATPGVVPSHDSDLLPAVLTDQPQRASSPVHTYILKGLGTTPGWQEPLRLVRNTLRRDGLRHIPRRPWTLRSNVTMASVLSELIIAHARAADHAVYYRPVHDWFAASPQVTGERPSIALKAITATTEEFATEGVRLPDVWQEYLLGWVCSVMTASRSYLERIRDTGPPLPEELWIGTAGGPYSRLLATAALEQGRRVVGHDHGCGMGVYSSWVSTAIEFPFVDRFVTFSPFMAEVIQDEWSGVLKDHGTEVTSPVPGGARLTVRRKNPALQQDLDVLYITTIYERDRPLLAPLIPRVTAIDWQARLFSHLRSWGLKVGYKPHPEDAAGVPPIFTDEWGIRLIGGRFGDLPSLPPALLFDHPWSTTFREALATDRAIIVIQMPVAPLPARVLAELERRCAFVQTWLDDNNRVRIDWDALKLAITESQDKAGSPETYEKLYGG